MAYQYQPLIDPSEFIRIAMIHPGSYSDPIRANFILRRLKDPIPEYEALSYAWGSDHTPSSVHVDITGQPTISITRNLDIALRHYRPTRGIRFIWIDALCIDQSSLDPREKNKQVSIMDRIFSTAIMVLIWLGPEQDKSNEAMGLMEHIGSQIENDHYGSRTMRPSAGCAISEHHWSDVRLYLPFQSGELTPILNLFKREYFKRVWIRQEITLSSYGSIACGAHTMDLNLFRKAVICVAYKGFDDEAFESNSGQSSEDFDGIKRLVHKACCTFSNQYFYEDLRSDLDISECRDSRDKIFAVLALLHESDRRLGIEPDYSLSAEKLYVTVARRFLAHQQSLNLLESCNLTSRTLDIPSWTPDWSTPWPHDLYTFWSACGWISPCLTILSETQVRVTGVEITQVESWISFSRAQNIGIAVALNIILTLKPPNDEPRGSASSTTYFAERLAGDIFDEWAADTYVPERTEYPTRHAYAQVIERIWDTNCSDITMFERECEDIPFRDVLELIDGALRGMALCRCVNGSVALSFPGVQEGDVVAVLLGCRFPVFLRSVRSTTRDHPQIWQVVSAAKVTGLMGGEAIYGDKIPKHWRQVLDENPDENDSSVIDRRYRGMFDSEANALRTNPAEILEEMGIKVESYQREPHSLVVLPETLRAAGIPLQDFILA